MPNCIAKMGKKWRVIECDSEKITKNEAGTAVDGGGHNTEADALAQAKAINTSQHRKGKY